MTIEYVVENYEELIARCAQDQEEKWFIMDCFNIDFIHCETIEFVLKHVIAFKALQKAGLGFWFNIAKGVPENIGRLIEAGYDEADVLATAECELDNRSTLEQYRAIKKAIEENRLIAKLVEFFPGIDANYVDKLAKTIVDHRAPSNN